MSPAIFGILIPLAGIIMGISAGMLGMYLSYRKRKEIFALYHQERMAAIEKGVDVPPLPESFFSDSPQPASSSPRRSLLKGLIWFLIGVALIVALLGADERDVALFGLIPAGIGLAYLIYFFAEGRKYPRVTAEKPETK